MSDLVECHSGYTYAEKPLALTWEGRRLEIVAILAQWRTPDEKHFRVRTRDGREFELVYREACRESPEGSTGHLYPDGMSGHEYPEKTSGHTWQIHLV